MMVTKIDQAVGVGGVRSDSTMGRQEMVETNGCYKVGLLQTVDKTARRGQLQRPEDMGAPPWIGFMGEAVLRDRAVESGIPS